jgi:hypothetical protein
MKAYTWNDINVFQYQQLIALFTEEGNTELDLIVRAGSIVTGKTEHEIDAMPYMQLKELGDSLKFIHTEIEPFAVQYIKANGRNYRCIYDIRKMPVARYIETKHFGSDTVGNLHRLAASMVMPQKRWMKFGHWVDAKYDASKHADYANDMLSAPVVNVLGSIVFFCEVYLRSMWSSRVFLATQMLKATPKRTMEEALQEMTDLCVDLDGIIRHSWLANWRESDYRKRTN